MDDLIKKWLLVEEQREDTSKRLKELKEEQGIINGDICQYMKNANVRTIEYCGYTIELTDNLKLRKSSTISKNKKRKNNQ